MTFPTQNRGSKYNETKHLCDAFALCQSIVNRYKRSGTEFTPAETKAMEALVNSLPTPNPLDGSAHSTSSFSHNSADNLSFLDQPSSTGTASVTDITRIMSIVQICGDVTTDIKTVLNTLNKEMALALGASNVRTYIFNANDNILIDYLTGAAASLNNGTALGKSANTAFPYTIAKVLYIPLRVNSELVGCIEASQGIQPNGANFESLIRVVALTTKNIITSRKQLWETQKAEAMLNMATRLARDALDENVLIQSIMNTAKLLTESDRCSMFIVKDNDTLEAHFEDGTVVSIPSGTGIAGYVARTGDVVNIPNAYEDERFNRDVDRATGYHTKTILCLPVRYEGTIVAVAQLINKQDLVTDTELHLSRVFGKRDEELFATFSMFAGASLRNCRINDNLLNEKRKSDAILDVVTLLSNTDIRDVNGIVRHVLHGAKKLLSADRSSLFLLDKERNELYSRMADSVSGNEIRFPSGQGIAGTVAASGAGENIPDAYKDPRFNSSVDKQLGYRTQSILCEPIVLNGEVLAVVQLVNKTQSDGSVIPFTAQDSDTFQVFALFAGISINNSHLLEFAVNAGREAMELNEYRSGHLRERSMAASSRNKIQPIAVNERDQIALVKLDDSLEITSTSFNLFDVRENCPMPLNAAAALIYKLLLSTGLPQKFGCRESTLLNFILQCRKKYRFVPYHNFFHVVDVCQTLHTFLFAGKACDFLTDLECYVLLITALVHDLDHMGVNNSFYLKTDSPLGILSSASGNHSVLEVHHCNLAIEILSNPDSDVFEGLSSEEVRFAYRGMIDCVLATDMAKHNAELGEFLELAHGGFVKENDDHRRKVMEILMKAGDVSNVTKPFDISRLWAQSVTEEFYRQGDIEKEKGIEVLPMFDRSKNNELARGQIGFIDFVAGKFFTEIVSAFFHDMQWCVENVRNNRAQWQAILESKKSESAI